MVRLSEAARALDEAVLRGQRATALHLSGAAADPIIDLRLVRAPELPPQRLLVGLDARHVARMISASFKMERTEPEAIALYGAGPLPLAACLLRSTHGAQTRRLLAPRPFRDRSGRAFWETLDEDDLAWSLVTLTAWTPPDAGIVSLHVAGVLAPPATPRVRWAVHVDPLCETVPWRDTPEVRALAGTATPVAVVSLAGAVVSLWHDVALEPWPNPDPYVHRSPLDEIPRAQRSPLPRRWSVLDESRGTPPEHALDRWALARMTSSGARNAQLVLLEGQRVALARAYTYAEEGYPCAQTDAPVRLGSLSKCVTALALDAAVRRLGVSIDAPLATLPNLADLGTLASLTLRELLEHRAGFPPRLDLRHDAGSSLAESNLAHRFRGADGRATPAMLMRALAAGEPRLGGRTAAPVYSNDGYILIGELLRRMVGASSYVEAVSGELPGLSRRSILLANGRTAASARAEFPAQPTLPTWLPARFADPSCEPNQPAHPSYTYDGSFIAAAAGLSMPLTAFAEILASQVAAPHASACGLDTACGMYVAERGWWNTKCTAHPSCPHRFVRVHNTGRLEGGTAFVVHQVPTHPSDGGRSLTLAFALNVLSDLSYARDGAEAFQALKLSEIP